MSNDPKIDALKPKTLDGIKKLAKKIGRADGIPHNKALEIASRQAGYENFQHARKQLVKEGQA